MSETAPAAAAPVADAAAAPAVAGDAGADVGAAAPGVGAVLEAERGGGPVGAAAPGVVGPAVVGVAPAPHGVPIGANAAAPGARPTPAPLQQQALAQSANLVQAAPAIHSVATKESGPTVFGVQLRSQKALRAQQAPLPGFYMVAAQPDVPVMRDPVHNSVELRRIKTVRIL